MKRKKSIIASLLLAMILSISIVPGEAFAATKAAAATSTKPAVTKMVDTTKKAPVKKVVVKKAPVKKVVAKKAPVKKVVVKKAPVKKVAVKKAVNKK